MKVPDWLKILCVAVVAIGLDVAIFAALVWLGAKIWLAVTR